MSPIAIPPYELSLVFLAVNLAGERRGEDCSDQYSHGFWCGGVGVNYFFLAPSMFRRHEYRMMAGSS